ncbi:MAG: GGDEF domain-containing protein [Deltaproteobacteria bacterium]|nr:GGDEF domain-containing protein [Deltaproteobacteria bacterium]
MGRDDTTGTVVLKVKDVQPPKDGEKQAVLVLLYPPGPNMGQRHALVRAEHVVGRLADLDIPLDADSVSRRHARICRCENGWFVEDLSSTNGSFVNDQRVQKRELKDGDILRFGEAILKFLSGSNIETAYHEEIYRMSVMDGLTGVYNKRYFLEYLEREIARSLRHDSPLSLVMFDIDHFKKINDQHGHLVGDAVLKELCRRLKPRIRRDDLLARFGGEEFACVLPATARAGSMSFADDLRQHVEREPFSIDDFVLNVTISLGVATCGTEKEQKGDHLLAVEEFIRDADERLYVAKRAGRNRVA